MEVFFFSFSLFFKPLKRLALNGCVSPSSSVVLTFWKFLYSAKACMTREEVWEERASFCPFLCCASQRFAALGSRVPRTAWWMEILLAQILEHVDSQFHLLGNVPTVLKEGALFPPRYKMPTQIMCATLEGECLLDPALLIPFTQTGLLMGGF